MARKTVEESEQTRLKLMEAGTRMFAQHGFAYSTLDDIARCAGLSRGAVYWHFKGKGDLLQSILNAAVLPLEKFFVACNDSANGFERFSRALSDTLNVQRHRDLCTILLKDSEVGTPECPVVVRWRVARQNLRAQLTLLLDAHGPLSPACSQGQRDALAHLMVLSITGLIIESLHTPQPCEELPGPFVQTLQALVYGADNRGEGTESAPIYLRAVSNRDVMDPFLE
jgi:AcrR family transcriptional regulator